MLNHKSNYIIIFVVMHIYTYTLKTKWRINSILCLFWLNSSMKCNIFFISQVLLNSLVLTANGPVLFLYFQNQRVGGVVDEVEFIMTLVSQNY